MSIAKISFSASTFKAAAPVTQSQFQRNLEAVRLTQNKAATDAAFAAPAASASAAAVAKPADNFTLRQEIFGVAPPVLTNAPDADGRTGSYRKAVQGIDPAIPGNPGYADYCGLGGTAAAADQAERNKLVIANAARRPGSATL